MTIKVLFSRKYALNKIKTSELGSPTPKLPKDDSVNWLAMLGWPDSTFSISFLTTKSSSFSSPKPSTDFWGGFSPIRAAKESATLATSSEKPFHSMTWSSWWLSTSSFTSETWGRCTNPAFNAAVKSSVLVTPREWPEVVKAQLVISGLRTTLCSSSTSGLGWTSSCNVLAASTLALFPATSVSLGKTPFVFLLGSSVWKEGKLCNLIRYRSPNMLN